MNGAENMVIEDMISSDEIDWVVKAVSMVAKAGMKTPIGHKLSEALNSKDKKWISDQIADSAKAIARDRGMDEATIDMLKGQGNEYKNFQEGLVSAVLCSTHPAEDAWYVTAPPCKGNLSKVKGEVGEIVRAVRNRIWSDAEFRKHLKPEEVEQYFMGEIADLKARIAEMTRPEIIERFPSPTAAFVGREDKIDEIMKSLEGAPVFVAGFGGIGKTELCKKLAQKLSSDGRKVVWVTYSGSLAESVASQVEVANLEFSQSADAHQVYDKKRALLAEDGNAVLIVDNHPGSEDYNDLLTMGCPVVVTTRTPPASGDYVKVDVGVLSPEDAFRIFSRVAGEENSQWVEANSDRIREVLAHYEHHTLIVSLLGGLVAVNNPYPGEPFDKVFNLEDKKVSRYGSDSQDTVKGHIGAIFDASGLDKDPDLKAALRIVSLLPAGGMEWSLFSELSDIPSETMKHLEKSNWLRRSDIGGEAYISIHPVIAELIRSDYPASMEYEECRAYTERMSRKLSENFYELNPTQRANIVDAALLLLDLVRGDAMHFEYAYRLACILESMVRLEEALDVLETIDGTGLDDDSAVKVFLEKASIKMLMDDLKGARADLDAAEERFETLGNDGAMWIEIMERKGDILKREGNSEGAFDCYMEVLEYRRANLPRGDSGIARALDDVGTSMVWDPDKGLEYCMEAKRIFSSADRPDRLGLSYCCMSIGRILRRLDRTSEAMENFQEALVIMQAILPLDHPDLATVYREMALVMSLRREYTRAAEYLQKSLDVYEKSLPPYHTIIGDNLYHLACAYSATGDLTKALECFERARSVLSCQLPGVRPSEADALLGLADAHRKIGDYEAAMAEVDELARYWKKNGIQPEPVAAAVASNIWLEGLEASGREEEAAEFRRIMGKKDRVLRCWEELSRHIGPGIGSSHPWWATPIVRARFSHPAATLPMGVGSMMMFLPS